MTKRKTQSTFLIAAGILSILIAALLSPFASDYADGLERVANDLGFINHAEQNEMTATAPMPDYIFPGIEQDELSTAFAGMAGTLAVLLITIGLGRLLATRKQQNDA